MNVLAGEEVGNTKGSTDGKMERKMKRVCFLCAMLCMMLLPSMVSAGAIIRGTVLDDKSGNAMVADVFVYQRVNDEWSFAGSQTTNRYGKFNIDFLGAGIYHLRISESAGICDSSVAYCADRYLPQFYNNVPLWDFEHIEQTVLKDGDVKDLNPIRLELRPFYFKTARKACEPVDSDGMVKITRKVVNTTNKSKRMFFWGVMDSPFRLDSSAYYNLQASYSFREGKSKLLEPGVNTVTFTHKLGSTAIKGNYYYWIVGGDSKLMPMTPYLSGSFCNDAPEARAVESSCADGAATNEDRSTQMKTIPMRITADGKVLERGPLAP
jgi:hypothetical protein